MISDEKERDLEKLIGYKFQDASLLETALSHSSYSKERTTSDSNERLEFLGDSVFNMIIASYLYEKFPNANEGKLSKIKSMLVSKKSLLELAKMLNLEDYLMVGNADSAGALASREKENILADCAEAVIGAIFLDSGIDTCRNFIIKKWVAKKKRLVTRDYKSRLQEVIQKSYKKIPEYRLSHSWGPEHAKNFEVEAVFDSKILGKGSGRNKKEAEQSAAKQALLNFKNILKNH
ncbi:MAG: ribonuclease III [Elusimicrobiota bacterium]